MSADRRRDVYVPEQVPGQQDEPTEPDGDRVSLEQVDQVPDTAEARAGEDARDHEDDAADSRAIRPPAPAPRGNPAS